MTINGLWWIERRWLGVRDFSSFTAFHASQFALHSQLRPFQCLDYVLLLDKSSDRAYGGSLYHHSLKQSRTSSLLRIFVPSRRFLDRPGRLCYTIMAVWLYQAPPVSQESYDRRASWLRIHLHSLPVEWSKPRSFRCTYYRTRFRTTGYLEICVPHGM